MRFHKALLFIALAPWFAYGEDPLTTALKTELGQEWNLSFEVCLKALKLKGQGKDDEALKQLLSAAPSPQAKAHYKIAQSRPDDAFWKLFASAAYPPPPPPPAFNCESALANVLAAHFALRPEDLGSAAKDLDTSQFLMLYDLLAHIPNVFPAAAPPPTVTQAIAITQYRACANDGNLPVQVKQQLGIP
jgi:hypothetical protein